MSEKKEEIAALHRNRIMKAAETLFMEKGYVGTTIQDISKASDYSRRTIYVYYESKEDILYHIVEHGLLSLKQELESTVDLKEDFITNYKMICTAIGKYVKEYPYSANQVSQADADFFEVENLSDTVKHILQLGTQINEFLSEVIGAWKKQGIVKQDVIPMLTVYLLWSEITSLISIAQKKGNYITKQFSISEDEFLDYGFRQFINSILETRI